MNYEQKYKDALEGIQEILSSGADSIKMSRLQLRLQGIFPELKESEDERIRGAIIDHLKDNNLTEWATWLEKQGEHKSVDKVEPKFQNGQWVVWQNKCYKVNYNGCGYELIDQNGLTTSCEYGTIDESAHIWTIADAKPGSVLVCKGNIKYSNGIKYERICLFKNLDNAFFTLTKTSNGFGEYYNIDVNIDYPDNTVPATKEQKEILFMTMKEAGYEWDADTKELKNANKIEPKFHEGDWVVQENIGIYKVIEVCESWYEVIDLEDNHYSIPFDKEYMCYLWTTADAKPGDVLVHNGCTFIFMGIKDGIVQAIEENMVEIVNFGEPDKDNDYFPATKEQRNTLMKAMADAGYEWDSEKKELKKVEFNPDDLIEESYQQQADDLIDMVTRKSLWSEEDERICQCLIRDQEEALDNVRNDKYGHSEIISDLKEMYRERIDWLKSLKERVLSKNT